MRERNRNSRRGPNASPEVARCTIGSFETCGERKDGQFEYTAVAQFFDRVNDRMMIFRRGAFAKTITEGIPSGRIKINDAHHHSSRDTVGTVIEAEERTEGLWYRGLLSSTEGDLYAKMTERHVEENSIEFFSVEEGVARVPFEDIPEGTFIWEQQKGDGLVEVRDMLVVSWVGLGILPSSSQGVPARFEFNAAVPFQDLDVASRSTAWDPDGAAGRLRKWAGSLSREGGPVPNWSRMSTGFLARGPIKNGVPQLLGQVADVEDGRLVVVPEALEAAMEVLAKDGRMRGQDLIACGAVAADYQRKSAKTLARTGSDGLESAVEPAGPALPPTDEGREAPDRAAAELQRREAKMDELRMDSLSSQFRGVLG